MNHDWSERHIIDFIKKELLLGRLELADTGLSLEDIRDDEPLLDAEGLALDSVDALDLLVGIEKAFSLKMQDVDKAFIDATCKSIRTLTGFILAGLSKEQASA